MAEVWQPHYYEKRRLQVNSNVQGLSYSKWRCKYRIEFAPKYRGQIIYKKLRSDIEKILRDLCTRRDVNILGAEWCPGAIFICW